MNLTRREVKGRYSQSLFGAAWAIAQPLATMAVFTLVFSRLAQMPSGGAPYPLFAFAALVPWFFFSNSVMSGTMSLVTYRNIVTKTYFPREIVPLAQVGSRLVDLAASSGLFVAADDLLPGRRRALGCDGAGVPGAAGAVHARRDADHLRDQRVLSRRQSGGADRPAAVAVSHAGGVSVVGRARTVSRLLAAEPAGRRRGRPARRAGLRPRTGLGHRRHFLGIDCRHLRDRRGRCSRTPTSISPT